MNSRQNPLFMADSPFLLIAQEKRALLQQDLRTFLAEQRLLFKEYPLAETVFTRLEETTLLGKQWRGLLVMMMAEAFGWKQPQVATRLATAVELLQTALLIHDDIIDQDEVRRGRASMWAAYQADGNEQQLEHARHYGISQAVCVGDISFFIQQQAVLSSQAPAAKLPLLWQRYIHESVVTGFAEMRDVWQTMANVPITEADVLALHRDKTAHYTFCLPFALAAILCDQPPKVMDLLNQLGEKLGMLFQLKDDELGLFGTTEQIGKSAESDAREGKKTLYYLFMTKQATPTDRETFLALYGQSDIGPTELHSIRELVTSSGAKAAVQATLEQLEQEVSAVLAAIPLSERSQQLFADFIALNTRRVR